MCMSVLPAYVFCAMNVFGMYQKNASDPLELELQMVMSYHVGAENQTQDL